LKVLRQSLAPGILPLMLRLATFTERLLRPSTFD
jgi:hypothetical protein